MNKLDFTINSVEQIAEAATRILQYNAEASGPKVFAFNGPMGSGKTTIIKEICRQLGSLDNFSSPTYSIVNEYLIENSAAKIYHIDLYRLKDIEEALGIGIEEYLDGNNYCFIEWPELVDRLLPIHTTHVDIVPSENTREISIFIK